MSIAYGGIIAFLFRGANLIAAFGTVLLTSRTLSREEMGTFVLGLVVIGVVGAGAGGLTAATAYQVSNQRRAPAAVLLNGGLIGLGLGLVAVVAGVAGARVLSGEASRLAVVVAAAAAAVTTNSVVAGIFLGRESLIRYNLALVTPPAFSLVAIAVALFAFDTRSATTVLAVYAAGQWAAVVVLVVSGGGGFEGSWTPDRALTVKISRFALLAGGASMISYLTYRADTFIVQHFEGDAGVATYGLAVYVAESVWQVSGSLALATYARVGSLARTEAAELTARVMRHTVVLLGAICLVLFALADVVQWVFGAEKYEGVASALRYLLPGILLYGLAQSYSGFYTYQRGLPWVAALVAALSLVLGVALAFALVPAMGVDGAALASSIAYGTAILVGLGVFVRGEHLRPRHIFRFGAADVEDYRVLLTRLRSAVRH